MATYLEIYNAFVAGGALRSRAVVAAAKFALYIKGEAANTPNHANRIAWAEAALVGDTAETEVDAIKWALASDPNVLLYGDALIDQDLSSAVETQISTFRITPAA